VPFKKERLTGKLRGRTEAPEQRRGRTLSFRTRGAKQTTHHEPLQRLLGIRWQQLREVPDCAHCDEYVAIVQFQNRFVFV
jgi:hypothetical protein